MLLIIKNKDNNDTSYNNRIKYNYNLTNIKNIYNN